MTAHKIIFGGGCFWCTEAIFRRLKGVVSVTSGYAGGETKNPSYNQISNGDTGHAEVIQVEFDRTIIDLETLLSVFFSTHDPTTLNQQGYDRGAQYRSIILYTEDADKEKIEQYITQLEADKTFPNNIVTEIKSLQAFYEAEEYHKEYYEKNSDARYCQLIIDPKIAKLRSKFAHLLKEV